MHERSFARRLLQQAAQICREQGAIHCLEVRVQIGPLSGIEASLLQSAFDQLAGEFGANAPQLVIDRATLMVRCRECGTVSELPDFDFRCRACNGRAVQVIQGDQLQLVSVTVEDEAQGVVSTP